MKIRLYPIVLPLMLGLAACVTEYSKSEAPDQLRVDGAEIRGKDRHQRHQAEQHSADDHRRMAAEISAQATLARNRSSEKSEIGWCYGHGVA